MSALSHAHRAAALDFVQRQITFLRTAAIAQHRQALPFVGLASTLPIFPHRSVQRIAVESPITHWRAKALPAHC